MKLPLSAAVASSIEILDETPSTNDVLVARASDHSDFAVVVTGSQTAGRGRLGREWIAPPGRSLAVSLLLRPVLPAGEPLSVEHFGWLPLIAGVAMARAVDAIVEAPVGLKWPNDVQISGLKVCGILAELVPTGDAVVMGSGINLSFTADELPTPTSTSLLLAGAELSGDDLADAVLSRYLTSFRALYNEFVRLGADAEASGLRDAVRETCATLGQQVRVQLPNSDDLYGTATDVDRHGRLVVRSSADGSERAVAAGDVTHVRYE
jgi:BirA family transcriptional regulator, biotin operon repressor / biotin---[acetyl-CoA-carboxylase] ligase